MSPQGWLTLPEAAEKYGVQQDRLRRAALEGRLPARKVGSGRSMPWLVQPQDVEKFLGVPRPRPGVFLVHAPSDNKAAQAVSDFIRQVGFDVVEFGNSAPVVGDAWEHLAEASERASFAVVLPGNRTASEPAGSRPNVLLELGYLLGKMGRERLALLVNDRSNLPSDLSGLSYVRLDEHGAWRFMLAREMRAAGLPVDLNQIV